MPPWQRCGIVVVAAGKGLRFGGWKQLASIAGEPLVTMTLGAFVAVPCAARVVVVPQEWLADGTWEELHERWPHAGPWKAVAGGERRSESVLAGLRALPPECEFAAVHDGARPFPPIEAADQALGRLAGDGELAGVIVARQVTDTVKQVDPLGRIERTLPREELRAAETPQIARRPILEAALSGPAAADARDEAQALEWAGHRTAMVCHEAINIKVTHRGDIVLAEAILREREEYG